MQLVLLAQDEAGESWGLMDTIKSEGAAFLWNLVIAVAIFFIGKLIAGFLCKILEGMMRRGKLDETLLQFLGNIAFAGMMVFIVL
ncbi:MAG TPA: hypothetical protein VLA12_13720, partial [Planctomycetaceae bacterium]|nr:hypothetical protein [Planctomycetaceae bacterium]